MNGVQIVALLAKLPLYQLFLSEYKNFAYIYMLFKKPEILNKIFKFIKRGKILSFKSSSFHCFHLLPNCEYNEGGENGGDN